MEKFGQSQPMRRVEDVRLLRGEGRYTDDIAVPGALHGVVLRSPYAAATIRRIDAAAARAMPGVHLITLGADLQAEGIGGYASALPLPNVDGTPRHDSPRPVLSIDSVHHVGVAVAFVVADTLDQARDAAEAIEVDYDGLPAVADPVAAMRRRPMRCSRRRHTCRA